LLLRLLTGMRLHAQSFRLLLCARGTLGSIWWSLPLLVTYRLRTFSLPGARSANRNWCQPSPLLQYHPMDLISYLLLHIHWFESDTNGIHFACETAP
jgi:hypothetical protein